MLRYLVAAGYIASLMGSGAVVSLVIATLLLRWLGTVGTNDVIGTAIEVGAALCVVGIGVRLFAAGLMRLRSHPERAH